jgi:hypothetical protein
MSDSSKSKDGKEVEVFHRINRLKIKAGGEAHDGALGQIDPAAIEKANSVITQAAEMYPMQIRNVLKLLNKAWDETKDKTAEERKDKAERISNLANNVKDLALQFGFEIMGYFGGSLRDYIMRSDLTQPEHVIIVQAHIDVMDVAYREGLKDEESPMAEELKQVIAKAIDKYS